TINGLIAGQTPTISIPTTAGVQTVVGPAAGTTPVGAPVTVTGTVTGLPLLSSTVTVSVNNPVGGAVNIVAQGPLNCAGTPVPPVGPFPPIPGPGFPGGA